MYDLRGIVKYEEYLQSKKRRREQKRKSMRAGGGSDDEEEFEIGKKMRKMKIGEVEEAKSPKA